MPTPSDTTSESVRVNRYYVNVRTTDPELFHTFAIPKASVGVYAVKYFFVAWNQSTNDAEVFLEYEESVRQGTLEGFLHKSGFTQIIVATFKHNDGNESASAALHRVQQLGFNAGYQSFTKGSCNDALLAKVNARRAEDRAKASVSEFEEKTQAAIKHSLNNIQDTVSTMKENVETSVESTKSTVESTKATVDSTKATVDSISTSVENGFGVLVPEYEIRIKDLQKQVATLTKKCDQQEAKTGNRTKEMNKLACQHAAETSKLNETIMDLKDDMSLASVDAEIEIERLADEVKECNKKLTGCKRSREEDRVEYSKRINQLESDLSACRDQQGLLDAVKLLQSQMTVVHDFIMKPVST